MDMSSTDQRLAALAWHRQAPGRQLIRVLYTNNPFYLISAWLVFSGLRTSFNTGGATFETWALLGGLATYSLLLATAACVLIRLGRVWEDIRTLALLVLLMFLAISVSLDEALTTNPARGSFWLIAGFVFAVSLSEALLLGLRVRLRIAYRLPYHLTLALFFLYPVALGPWVVLPESGVMKWGLFGFSTVAGLIFLLLLPGIRRGDSLLQNNGTPWNWPWYPLTLFLVLAVAVCLRAYFLCSSLHFVGYDWSIFGSYFLVPFLAALNVVWLEIGMVTQNRRVTMSALAVPMVWLWLGQSKMTDDTVYVGFLQDFQAVLHATPLFLALAIAVAFFAVAALRRIPWAAEACLATLASMSVIGPRTLTLGGPYLPTGWPLLAVGVVLFISGAWNRESLRAALASILITAGTAIELRETWTMSFGFTAFGEIVPMELLLALLLCVGFVFRDRHVSIVRLVAALLLVWVGGVVSASHGQILGAPDWLVSGTHLLIWTAIATGYGRYLNLRDFYFVAAVDVSTWSTLALVHGYKLLQPRVAGLQEIGLGLGFFILAFIFSVWKTRRLREVNSI
jgi:hypothetical protein